MPPSTSQDPTQIVTGSLFRECSLCSPLELWKDNIAARTALFYLLLPLWTEGKTIFALGKLFKLCSTFLHCKMTVPPARSVCIEWILVKHLEECLAHSKCSENVSHCYSCAWPKHVSTQQCLESVSPTHSWRFKPVSSELRQEGDSKKPYVYIFDCECVQGVSTHYGNWEKHSGVSTWVQVPTAAC